MLRARGARLKEEKAAKGEEAEAPVGPLGRATEADKLLMSTAEVKALPGTEVVELPARAGGVSAGTGAAIPSARKTPVGGVIYPPNVAKEVVDKAELRRLAPTAEAGRDVRKAAGNEQTGAAAGTVAASIPPIATGTPKNAPTYEVMQGDTKYTVDATPMFTPAELAEMNAPETPAQRKARVMREMRSKLGETPATSPIP
jgi:hypothetical protein